MSTIRGSIRPVTVALAAIAMTIAVPAGAVGARPPRAAVIAGQVTGVPIARALAIGGGTASPLKQIEGPFLRASGKPLMLYVGAEFCSYCAAERWAIVNALSRFGTFRGLGLTSSTTDDSFPATPSFSFHGSSYTSRFVTLQTVELSGNTRDLTGSFPRLETVTKTQQNIAASLDRPPYAPERGSIPFIVIAGRFVLFSSQYQPGALQGLNAAQVAGALSRPASPAAQGILGAANWLTASLCEVTRGKPATACTPKAITALRRQYYSNP
jgi:uncharacterized protein DUF929